MKKLFFSILMLLCLTTAMAQPSPGGGYTANSYSTLKACVENAINNGIPKATITLTADIYLSDGPESTLTSTFSGTLDGNGHTIWAAHPEVAHDGGGHYKRSYLFTKAVEATFRNITFRDFRVESSDNNYVAVIAQEATNKCNFENITFDNISIWTKKSAAGAIAGYAGDCTFSNIKVMNSDFTVDGNHVGALLGGAKNCRFTNIVVENCECTADDDNAGGVVGLAQYDQFNNVVVKNTFITVNGNETGGVAGWSDGSVYDYCETDDQSCVCSDGNEVTSNAYAGGIVGYSGDDMFRDCINSALIVGDGAYVGGIAGYYERSQDADYGLYEFSQDAAYGFIERCLNTGMVIGADKKQVLDELYRKYKNKEFACVAKQINGKTYEVRLPDSSIGSSWHSYFGGIIGYMNGNIIVRTCTNFGSMNETRSTGGIAGCAINVFPKLESCLSDFEGRGNKIYGLLGDYSTELWGETDIHIEKCLNASRFPLCPESAIDVIHGKDAIYSLHRWSKFDNSDKEVIAVTEEQIASGYVANILKWHQNIGKDRAPIPGYSDIYYDHVLDNDISTICLPFAVKSDQNVQYYKPQSAGFANGNEAIYYIRLVPVARLAAGEPGFYRALKPGVSYFVRKTEDDYQFVPQDYTISYPSADGDRVISWTMKGAYVNFSNCNETHYSLNGRELKNPETVAPFSAYFSGPAYSDEYLGLSGKPIYIVNHTSPYDVNFDDEVNVADVIEFIHLGEDFNPFVFGTNLDNREALSEAILQELR